MQFVIREALIPSRSLKKEYLNERHPVNQYTYSGQKSNAQTIYSRTLDVKRVKQEQRIIIVIVFMTNHSKHFRSSIPTQIRVCMCEQIQKLFQDTLVTEAFYDTAVNAIILPRTHQTQKTRRRAARKKDFGRFHCFKCGFCQVCARECAFTSPA